MVQKWFKMVQRSDTGPWCPSCFSRYRALEMNIVLCKPGPIFFCLSLFLQDFINLKVIQLLIIWLSQSEVVLFSNDSKYRKF